jgi:hypothetical protein
LSCCAGATLPHAAIPAARTNNEASANCGANCPARPAQICSLSASSIIATPKRYSQVRDWILTRGNFMEASGECGVVAMDSTTVVLPLPAGTVPDGMNEAVEPTGNPVTVKETGLAVAVFAGVNVKLKFTGLPATTELLSVDAVILKSSTMTASAEVVPPPGFGLLTVMFNVPLRTKSLAVRAALREVELTNVVARGLPLAKTEELVVKFVPTTFNVIAAFPAATVDGERLLAPGMGLFTVNVTTTDGAPPGFATVTSGVPATVMALAGTAACS